MTYFLILLIVIIGLYTVRRLQMGRKAIINKKLISDKVILIFSYKINDFIKNIISSLSLNNNCKIILISNEVSEKEHKSYSSHIQLTQMKIDLLNLEEVNSLLENIKSNLFRIDFLFFNRETFKFQSNREKDVIQYNNIVFFLILLKLFPILDRGDGRVVFNSGNEYERSELINISNDNLKKTFFKKRGEESVDYEELEFLNNYNSHKDNEFNKENINQLIFYGTKSLNKEVNPIKRLLSIEEIFSNALYINLIILDFFRKYTDHEYENIILNYINPGIYFNDLIDYSLSSKTRMLLFPFIFVLSLIFTKTTYWYSQSIIGLLGEKECFELLNGCFYSDDYRRIDYRHIVNENNKSIRSLIILSLVSYVKSYISPDDIQRIMKYIDKIYIKNKNN